MKPTQTALIVPVPEAEDTVGPFRMSLDRSAAWGVPAHVTVLYPFLSPDRINDDVLAAVAEIVRAVPRFDVTLTDVEWFADTVLWLAPEPAHPFRTLTASVCRLFPDTPPYAGAHTDVVPHLTIGHDIPHHELRRAAAAVAASLPIHAEIDVVRLMSGSPEPDSWHTRFEFPLGR
jgi:2'-5' RNA ligase